MPDLLFRGTAPALITPFDDDDGVDERALRRIIDFQIEGGVDALVVLGTTGENPTVTHEERRRIIDVALDQTARRVPVIVGTGTNNTAQSIVFSKEATASGADALLVVGPYYNKPTPAGLVAHVSAIADAADAPILLYNVPGRTGSNITAETTFRIADEVDSVFGVKEASADMAQISDLLRDRPEGFGVYSGDDDLTFPMLALGADGVVSVIANAVPRKVSEMVHLALQNDFLGARRRHFELLDAMRASFFESNPGPVKAVMAEMGLIQNRLRLPLAPCSSAVQERVLAAYRPHLESLETA
jgi:4-hydroxy-tetrahydrodipicolinate synthase